MMYFKKVYKVILKEAKFWANYYANGISLALNWWFLLLIFILFFLLKVNTMSLKKTCIFNKNKSRLRHKKNNIKNINKKYL